MSAKFPNFQMIKMYNDWGCHQDLEWYRANDYLNDDQYKELTGHDYQPQQSPQHQINNK